MKNNAWEMLLYLQGIIFYAKVHERRIKIVQEQTRKRCSESLVFRAVH